MWFVLEDTVPANTTYANRRETKLRVGSGILHSIIVTIPPGSKTLARFRLRKASYMILPRNEDKYIAGEHVNVNYREWFELKTAENVLTLETWNEDTKHDHYIRLLIGILPKGVMDIEEQYLTNLRMFMRLFRRRN